ncbi:MAG: tetratricopeptide repeat protein [Planctomycetota bacterium]
MRPLLPYVIVALAACLAVAPAREGGFVYDDHYYLLENPAVSGEASVWTTPLGTPDQALWRPLSVATYRWQWPTRVDGVPSAVPFRVVNILLHVLTSLILFVLARRWGLGAGGALAAALLFAVHPVHAEAVAWVSGRSELLATGLILAAWCSYLSPSRAGGLLAVGLTGAALLSKEQALLVPALFLGGDLALRQPPRWRRLAALTAAVVALFAARFAVLPQLVPSEAPFGALSLSERVPVALNILARSFELLLWPADLRVFYPRSEFLGWQPFSLGLLAAAALLTAWLWRRVRPAAAGLLLVPLSLALVLNLVPIGATFADRFLYLPSALFCLAVGAAAQARGRAEQRAGTGLSLSVLVPLVLVIVALLVCRNAVAVFHDDLRLWEHAARLKPDSAHIRYNHGYFLDRAGRHLALDPQHPGAAEELEASLDLDPGHLYAGYAHQTLGNIALRGDGRLHPDLQEAARQYRAAIRRAPGLWDARINLASVAVSAPGLVSPAEGLQALAIFSEELLTAESSDEPAAPAGLSQRTTLDHNRRQAIVALRAQLAELGDGEEAKSSTGTSSPEGS